MVTSIANPKLTKTMTLTVKAAIADEKYLAKLTSTTYLYTNTTYNYTFALTFKTDGTGTRIQTLTESGKTYTDTFSYTLKGTSLTFTNWSDNAPHDPIGCSGGNLLARNPIVASGRIFGSAKGGVT